MAGDRRSIAFLIPRVCNRNTPQHLISFALNLPRQFGRGNAIFCVCVSRRSSQSIFRLFRLSAHVRAYIHACNHRATRPQLKIVSRLSSSTTIGLSVGRDKRCKTGSTLGIRISSSALFRKITAFQPNMSKPSQLGGAVPFKNGASPGTGRATSASLPCSWNITRRWDGMLTELDACPIIITT